MEKMIHSTTSLPDCFVFPPDQVPPASSAVVSLPVVDMSCSRDEVRRAILDAGKELGFFQASAWRCMQVINHGVSEQAMQDMAAVGEEFFRLPAADKTGGERYWRDCLRFAYDFPVGNSTKDWPGKPHRLREVVENFTLLTRGLATELLRLLSEGMGLPLDYFEGDLSGGYVTLDINHYPPCPNPGITLGLPPHCDRDLMAILLPARVPGLEVAYKGDWIKVQPVPHAFVVNFGQQLEVVTNGMSKSIEHRVMTNSALARTSVAVFIAPTEDCLIGPAEEFLSKENPPCYRTLKFCDFKRNYNVIKLGSSLNLRTNLRKIQKEG
ncbi:hypothetical protein C2845_PM06G29760 [Panicum miliaceum]|uniref:Fe2OG dioxygenase domain-containing protein n=1 Tax=Panicum miliaceum TaxID=4540 RepID=A0A3L6RDF2_PANMI|nr:hypothetical protein C2845_PM06G29760 [Panicum miliaceum]